MKQKTKKAAIKRFKIIPKGKIIRMRQMNRHLKANKGKSSLARFKRIAFVSKPDVKNIERLMPYK